MKRVIVSVALLAFAAWMCVVGRPSAASDDPLTPAMKKQIDASLVVFVGTVAESSPRVVSYKIERFLKGTCFEPELGVRHAVDSAKFASGDLVIVGAQLWPEDGSEYRLRCDDEQLAPIAWTQKLEDAVLRHVADAPRGPTVPSAEARARRNVFKCSQNLSQLGQIYLMGAQENTAKARKYSGPALWLSMRKNAANIKRGDERVLLCPLDQSVRPSTSDAEWKAWDDVDLSQPEAGLCSYVGRDFVNFPMDIESKDKEPVGACLHHPGGAIVVFEGGDAQFVTLAELGLASDAEKIVGPESKSPLLRKLR